MNQNPSAAWSKTERVIFRFTFCYLCFYFLFFGNFFLSLFPVIENVHKPIKDVSDHFIRFINNLFIHKKFDTNIYTGMGDTSWFVITSFLYFILSFIITVAWSFWDPRKSYQKLFSYIHTYSRYYLAFVLFLYGLDKIFLNQFHPPTPDNLMQPLSNIDLHTLLWTFMSASKSYNFFTGAIEVIAASFLLFKRTTTLGAVIALLSLINILFLDIGYNTLVKSLVGHLLLIATFIITPDIRNLLKFFFQRSTTSLSNIEGVLASLKNKQLYYFAKFVVIFFMLFVLIKREVRNSNDYSQKYLGGLDGIYEVKEFHLNQQTDSRLVPDSVRWRKFAINKFGETLIQFMNDSSIFYSLNGDTLSKTINLTLWDDSTFKSKLLFTKINLEEYQFEGVFKNDSIRLITKKINLDNVPLLKDKGKMKWIWW